MPVEKKIEFEIDHHFDPVKCRHYLNDTCTVLHCHHYMTLFHQLADDAKGFEGERFLKEAAEDTFYDVLKKYFELKGIIALEEMICLAEQYWSVVGMGLIRFISVGRYAVIAEMEYSHVDEGWLKKWGGREEPVNFITSGFVSASAALFNGRPAKTFQTKETKALVCGDETSLFKAVIN
ncbi:MAG: hypothetical protein KKB20_19525 [Proteobacteria bacterium]|nr:hypothetical protein [Pseudomonadota bacterium]